MISRGPQPSCDSLGKSGDNKPLWEGERFQPVLGHFDHVGQLKILEC